MKRKLLGIINVDFDATGQLLTTHSAFLKYLRKKLEYNEAVHHVLQTSRKFMIQLEGRSCTIFSSSLIPHQTGKATNHLTPNGHFSGRTAPLTYRCFIFFLFIQQLYVLNILNMLHTLRFFLF
jgi:hypothetical protein